MFALVLSALIGASFGIQEKSLTFENNHEEQVQNMSAKNGPVKRAELLVENLTNRYKPDIQYKIKYLPNTDQIKVKVFLVGRNKIWYKIVTLRSKWLYDDKGVQKSIDLIHDAVGVLLGSLT